MPRSKRIDTNHRETISIVFTDMATGGSVDWVKEQLKVPLVYCYELRDRGAVGFLLPPEEILPSSLETMDSVLELIHQAKRFGVINGAEALLTSVLLMNVVLLAFIF